jgi:hypothetical protein
MELSKEFELTDLGQISHCLGCNVSRNSNSGDIVLSNETYIETIIKEFGMDESRVASTPIPPNTYLSPYDSPEPDNLDLVLQSKYRSLIGSLMFAAVYWRPDIAQATAHLSRFLHIPGERHMFLAKHILRYLKGTSNFGLLYKRDLLASSDSVNPLLIASCDANKSKESDAISTTGYCLQIMDRNSYLGENNTKENRSLLKQPKFNVISYASRRQQHVTVSSTYAEYIAAYVTTKRIMHRNQILHELGFDQNDKFGTILFIDNEGVEFIAEVWKIGERSLHMNNEYHLVRQEFIQNRLFIIHVNGDENITDYLSKPSEVRLFQYNRDCMMYGNNEDNIQENVNKIQEKKLRKKEMKERRK